MRIEEEVDMPTMREKVVLVTGAATGIGRAAALAFAHEGADVVVADIDDERGNKVAAEVEAVGVHAMFVHTDISCPDEVDELVNRTVERFGRIDYAFNNAGIEGTPAPAAECTRENWDRTIATNLTGVFSCMHAEIPKMLAQGGGVIVNNASVAGLVGFAGIPAYTASKHGVVGLTRNVALDYATQNIRVNAVCPGVIDTEMVGRFTHHDRDAMQELTKTEPIGRLGTPDEIADAVVWLCSDRASFVTGQAIAVDGGFVAQ
jgi:NAD(P)-dependent dehydrogenase (short-subunit alcohol dehydrogenase family)